MIELAHGALPGSPIWLPHNLPVSGAVVMAGILYLRASVPESEAPATGRKRFSFFSGLLVLWMSLDGPVEALSESIYIAHMVQHILLTLVAPPLLICGLTPWMVRRLLGGGRLLAIVARVARPLPALLLFNGTLAFSHAPKVVEWMIEFEPIHYAVHFALLGSATLMWLPVTSPIPEIRKLSYPAGMAYLLLQSVVPTIPASFLTFGSAPLYPVYNPLATQWGMSPLDDQQIAGLIMKIGGGLILWGIVAVFFFKWAAEEAASSAIDRPEPIGSADDSPELEIVRTGTPDSAASLRTEEQLLPADLAQSTLEPTDR